MDFEPIYRQYFQDIYYFLLSLSKNPTLAEDLTSESFFKALKNIDHLRKEESVKSYLFAIAKNTYFDYLRMNKMELEPIEELDFQDKTQIIEEIFIQKEDRIQVRNAIENLEEPGKRVIQLRVYFDFSFREIGDFFGKSDNWACVTFHRTKKKLKSILEREDENL